MSDIPKCPKCGATGAAGSNTTDCGCSLFVSKKLDNFEHESPIRAFTTFDVCGHYAIGKGFRPSMQHLAKYLDAMQRKEYWWLVQILFGDTEPTLVFRHHPLQSRPYKFPFNWPDDDDQALERFVGKSPALGMPYSPEAAFDWKTDPYEVLAELIRKSDNGEEVTSIDAAARIAKRELRSIEIPVGAEQIAVTSDGRLIVDGVELTTAEPDAKEQCKPRFDTKCEFSGFTPLSEAERIAARDRGFPNSVIIGYQEYAAGPLELSGDQEDYGDCDPPERPSITIRSDDIDPEKFGAVFAPDGDFVPMKMETIAAFEGHTDACSFVTHGMACDCKPVVQDDNRYAHFKIGTDGMREIEIREDDPVNPKHYDGTACAEIGELLSANSYQVLKYNWRLGGKDNECVEIDKSIWYLDREIALFKNADLEFVVSELPDYRWFDARLEGQPQHTVTVARALISWNRYGRIATLKTLRRVILSHRLTFECPEFGRQQEP